MDGDTSGGESRRLRLRSGGGWFLTGVGREYEEETADSSGQEAADGSGQGTSGEK